VDYLYANIDADIIDSSYMKFKEVTATIDDNTGEPSVETEYLPEEDTLNLAFHNLKGDTGSQGVQGKEGNGISNIELNENYGLVITLDNGDEYTTDSVRGPAGEGLDPETHKLPWSDISGAPDFALKSEIPDVSEFIDSEYLDSVLEGYLSKEEASDDYVTKTELEETLSNYCTVDQTESKIQDDLNDVIAESISDDDKLPTCDMVKTYLNDIIGPINERLTRIEDSLRGL
jgi:hypothetical protein